MPESEFIIPHRKQVQYATDGSTLPGSGWNDVVDTIDVTLPERELSASETTNDDALGYTKTYIAGMYEPGQFSFTYRYGKTQFSALETIFAGANDSTRTDAYKWWKVILPDGSYAAFRGFITAHNLPLEGAEDSPVVEVQIQVIGSMTYSVS
jgi:predicted secreted protein